MKLNLGNDYHLYIRIVGITEQLSTLYHSQINRTREIGRIYLLKKISQTRKAFWEKCVTTVQELITELGGDETKSCPADDFTTLYTVEDEEKTDR